MRNNIRHLADLFSGSLFSLKNHCYVLICELQTDIIKLTDPHHSRLFPRRVQLICQSSATIRVVKTNRSVGNELIFRIIYNRNEFDIWDNTEIGLVGSNRLIYKFSRSSAFQQQLNHYQLYTSSNDLLTLHLGITVFLISLFLRLTLIEMSEYTNNKYKMIIRKNTHRLMSRKYHLAIIKILLNNYGYQADKIQPILNVCYKRIPKSVYNFLLTTKKNNNFRLNKITFTMLSEDKQHKCTAYNDQFKVLRLTIILWFECFRYVLYFTRLLRCVIDLDYLHLQFFIYWV
uniref:DNA-directed RNA polymerase n=1 Tax=Heterorhabditis bacteriophora TaxID=37862 RepID=A0A1I7WII5_HETBA